jgi:hypothetical protein
MTTTPMKLQRALKWALAEGKDNSNMTVVLYRVFPDTYYGSEILGNRVTLPPHLGIYVTNEEMERCPIPDNVIYSENLNEIIVIYYF